LLLPRPAWITIFYFIPPANAGMMGVLPHPAFFPLRWKRLLFFFLTGVGLDP
jgi:hypothetical protein